MTINLPPLATKKLLGQSAEFYSKQLESDPLAVSYLKARGISKEAATYFRLGVVNEVLPESGHDFQKGRLSIPYMTPTGIVQIRFRAIPYDGIPGNPEPSPKIKSEAGATTTLYNVNALDSQVVCICEGEFDTMTCRVAGLSAVGVPGAQAWDKVFARAFKFRKVVILADNDDHGEGLKFAEKVQADVRGARIVLMDKGHDVNSYAVEFGLDALRDKVNL